MPGEKYETCGMCNREGEIRPKDGTGRRHKCPNCYGLGYIGPIHGAPSGGESLTDDQRKMVTTILGGFWFNKDKMLWENYLTPTQMAKVRQVLGDLFPIPCPGQ